MDNKIVYERPIDNIKSNTDEISKLIKSMRVDMSVIRADIKIIKEKLQEKEKVEKASGGWWIY